MDNATHGLPPGTVHFVTYPVHWPCDGAQVAGVRQWAHERWPQGPYMLSPSGSPAPEVKYWNAEKGVLCVDPMCDAALRLRLHVNRNILTLVYERNAVSFRRVVIGVVIGVAALAAAVFMTFAGSAIAYIP